MHAPDFNAALDGIRTENDLPAAARSGRPRQSLSTLREEKLLSSLVHKIGHEIGNPLTSIISLASIIERFGSPETAAAGLEAKKLGSYAGSIISEAWRISTLSEKLVMLLSHRKGNPLPCELGEHLTKALRKLRSRRGLDTTRVHVRFDSRQSPEIYIDPDQLLVLLSELLQNAFNAVEDQNASEEDDRDRDALVFVEADVKGEYTLLEVRNRLDAPLTSDLSELFDPFVTNFVGQKHLGIGLPMAQGIVERAGGTIELRQAKSDGAWYFITSAALPRNDRAARARPGSDPASADALLATAGQPAGAASQAARGSASHPPELNPSAAAGQRSEPQREAASVLAAAVSQVDLPSTLHVLIIEDEPTVASAIRKILEVALGSRTLLTCECLSGKEAVEKIEGGAPFDVMLCDLNLAQMSGRHVFQKVMEHRPEQLCRFAFLTGDQARNETQLFLTTSSRPFLHKPFEPQQLIALVAQLLEEARRQQADSR